MNFLGRETEALIGREILRELESRPKVYSNYPFIIVWIRDFRQLVVTIISYGSYLSR